MLVGLTALGLLLHGLLHLVGFFVPRQLAGIAQLGADEAAGGRMQLRPATSRVLGLLWLLIAAMAAAGLLFDASWTLGLIIIVVPIFVTGSTLLG
jgi:hypothetical protein